MSFKDKIMNMVTAHPKLVTLGIGLAVTFVVGISIGMGSPQSVLAQHVFSDTVGTP
jgi:hypothetical protein